MIAINRFPLEMKEVGWWGCDQWKVRGHLGAGNILFLDLDDHYVLVFWWSVKLYIYSYVYSYICVVFHNKIG